MNSDVTSSKFHEVFGSVTDPRIDRTRHHHLLDIIFIALTAVICGAEDFVTIAEYGKNKQSWFEKILDLPHGIPSHDTFQRVFARLDPKQLEAALVAWSEHLRAAKQIRGEEIIALDGKTLRHSFDNALGVDSIHIVSAWASQARLCLGHIKVAEKSNEITATPELLRLLDIRGCIVTADALNCQRATAEQITNQGGTFVLALKGNHSTLYEGAQIFAEFAAKDNYTDLLTDVIHTCDKGHDRIETRTYRVIDLPDTTAWADAKKAWPGLKSIGIAECTRQIDDKKSTETRYYLTGISVAEGNSAKRFARASRYHWGIENRLHWVLDVCFNEDDCCVRKDNGPENLATLRKLALNLIRRDTLTKAGIKTKRMKAGWNDAYLESLILN